MTTLPPVLIVGGGIGGLCAALALARRGIQSCILERRTEPSEAGAGIQLGPNATRILRELGVAAALEPFAALPSSIEVRGGITGKLVQRLPLGEWIAARHGAPYWVMHRADLHSALLAHARAMPLITIEPGAHVTGCSDDGAEAHVTLAGGENRSGRALIAADGLWSTLRANHFGTVPPAYTCTAAARAVIPIDAVPIGIARDATSTWLAPGLHMVHYPVRAGAEMAIVVVFPDTRDAMPGWDNALPRSRVEAATAALAGEARGLVAAAHEWRVWGLHSLTRPPMARGRVALLGDAAHPVKPFLAQGAVMAIEDAAVLADEVTRNPSNLAAAFASYRTRREPRVDRVAAASETNGRIYHLSGPLALARDATLRLIGGSRTMARYDWLYGWRAE